MTQMEEIISYLAVNRGKSYCDDCLSAALQIRPRQNVNQKTRVLAEDRGYLRTVDRCSACKSDHKIVIGERAA